MEGTDIISTYTRARAIEDGTLIDLTNDPTIGPLVRECGFRYHVACTATVFASCIELTEVAKKAHNDIKGRAWDVLFMLRMAIRRSNGGERITYELDVVRDKPRATRTELLAICGPDDNAAPCITIMFPGEE